MTIREISSKQIWEDFLTQCPEKTFLQSWNWGEFQKAMGNKIWRAGVFEEEKLIAVSLVIKVIAKRGNFLLIQHGPLLIQSSKFKVQSSRSKFKILECLLRKLKVIGKRERVGFIRIAALWEKNEQNEKIFQGLGFIDAPMHANAYTATWKLNLDQPPDRLLAQMRKTTRYLIRQAENNPEVTVEKRTNQNALALYQKLNLEVAKRQNFTPFSSEFIQKEFEAFSQDGQAQLFLGKYKGETLAGALIIFWSGLVFYHQAASSRKAAKIPLPYLIVWEVIKEAKNRGCRVLDFWGFVDPQKQPRHPWAGPTFFKMGFGGQAQYYVTTQDFPLTGKYWLTFAIEKLRKIKRRL